MSYPKKSLGQNYLTDENISRNIVKSFNINEDDNILEIGAGQGALTKLLLQKTNNLTVIELDSNNCKILSEKFPGLNIINKDFLKIDLKKISDFGFRIEAFGDKFQIPDRSIRGQVSDLRIIGNIPYNISSQIIFKLIDNREMVIDAQLMVQEEFARRLAAKPNTKDYGIPSVLVQVFSKPKLLFKVSRNCFYPKPRVDSRIIYFDFTNSMENKIHDVDFFRTLVKTAFSTRRKTLRNALKSLNLDLSLSDIDFSRRAESLSIDEFITLSNLLCSLK